MGKGVAEAVAEAVEKVVGVGLSLKSNLVENNDASESHTGVVGQTAEVEKPDPPSKARQKKQGEQVETKKKKEDEEDKVTGPKAKAKANKTKKNHETAEEKEIQEKPRKKKKTDLEEAKAPASSSDKAEKGDQQRMTRKRSKSTVEPEETPLPPQKFKRSIMKALAEFIDSTEWEALELDDLKPHVRGLLPTLSRCRLNIYWSRGTCGVGWKGSRSKGDGKGDFGYFSFASMKVGVWSFRMVAAIAAASELVARPVL